MYYSEDTFTEEEKKNNNYEIDNEIIELITKLSNELKTIDLTKNPFNSKKKYKNNDNKSKINFKETIFNKKVGIDTNIDVIRKNLNKISNNSNELIKNNIIQEIEIIINNLSDNDSINDIELKKVSEEIFKICVNNIFYSELFAKLFNELAIKYEFIKDNLMNNYNSFIKNITNINIVDPNIDYDKYCDSKKLCEKKKSICCFIVNLTKYKLINIENIITMVNVIQSSIIEYINMDDKKEIVDELSELLYIIITNGLKLLYTHKEWSNIYNNILYITTIKIKSKKSITNKTIFKHMDILDNLEDIN